MRWEVLGGLTIIIWVVAQLPCSDYRCDSEDHCTPWRGCWRRLLRRSVQTALVPQWAVTLDMVDDEDEKENGARALGYGSEAKNGRVQSQERKASTR